MKSKDNVSDGFTKCGGSEDYRRNFKCLRNVCHDIGISWQGRMLGYMFEILKFCNVEILCYVQYSWMDIVICLLDGFNRNKKSEGYERLYLDSTV